MQLNAQQSEKQLFDGSLQGVDLSSSDFKQT